MTNNDFIQLKDFLLGHLGFFNQGFANVYLDELTGLVHQGDGSEKFAVGINDIFGNYFYIRTDAEIRYSDTRPQFSDTRRSIDETVKCYLVAVVDDAKPKLLVQSLLNCILNYGNERIRPIRAIYHRETAVAKELSKLSDEDIVYALQHLEEKQVVIIEFDFTTIFTPEKPACIPLPCKTCSNE